MQTLDVQQCKDMLLAVADKIIASKAYLTQIDSAIGDGDHGIGMETGYLKVREMLADPSFSPATVGEVYKAVGKAMLNSMGGASGVIFSSMYSAGGKLAAEKSEVTAADLAMMYEAGLASIQKRGQAQVGDKTMVDALSPAVDAMKTHANSIEECFVAAYEGAHTGMESTKDMVAKFGRAKSLMERAIGHQDAGATSVCIIFETMRDFVQN